MRAGRVMLMFGACAGLLPPAFGQNFTNLDFESANIVFDPSFTNPRAPPYVAYATSAVPGWTISGYLGGSDLSYNAYSLGAPSVSLFGTEPMPNPIDGEPIPPPLDGKYSIDLYGGVAGGPRTYPSASISQTGLVPANAKSIQFIAAAAPFDGRTVLLVSLGGQDIPFTAISNTPDYTVYAGDVSAFAGQVEQLKFTTPFNTGVNNYWEIDDIQFSPEAVPEPAVCMLILLGGLLPGWRRLARLRRTDGAGGFSQGDASLCPGHVERGKAIILSPVGASNLGGATKAACLRVRTTQVRPAPRGLPLREILFPCLLTVRLR